jgi:hypothetical protein
MFWHGYSVVVGRFLFSNPPLQGNWFHVSLLVIMDTWKCYSLWFMTNSGQGYLAIVASLFRIHVCLLIISQPGNVFLQGSWEHRIKGILFSLITSSAFWMPENAISQLSWHPRLKVMWPPVCNIGLFEAIKCYSCRGVRPCSQGYKASSENCYSIFATRKYDNSSVMSPSIDAKVSSIHKASVRSFGSLKIRCSWVKKTWFPMSNFSSFWRPEKAIRDVSLNPPFQGNWFHVSHSSPLWQHENVILQVTLGWRVTWYNSATIQYFVGLIMQFLKCPETLGSTLRGHLWANFRHFRCLKTRFLARCETLCYRYMGLVKAFLVITLPKNTNH